MKMIRKWSGDNHPRGVVKAPAPPGCEIPTRMVPVAIGASDDDDATNSSSSDDDESLSTLYEAEEDPTISIPSDEDSQDDDVVIDSSMSSTVTVIHQQDASIDDVEDLEMDSSDSSTNNHRENEETRRQTKKVYRKLPEESSFIGGFIRGRLKTHQRPQLGELQTNHSDFESRPRKAFKSKATFSTALPLLKNENLMTSLADETSSLNTSQSSLASRVLSVTPRPPHFVVVAIDFGTTYSGYAFSFLHQPESVHLMRGWTGSDPGVTNQKTQTIVLLNPSGEFHSFGFEARDFYHDLDSEEAKRWIYLDRFKMKLHSDQNLSKTTQLVAANGTYISALLVFSHALRFFKQHALQELSDQLGTPMKLSDIRWVVTVPAIWRPQAKQFMRQAAYQAGLATESFPEQLVIALEPEAASIFCRKARYSQLQERAGDESLVEDSLAIGSQYMVVDCGGGTVDVTIHEVLAGGGIKEVEVASGGALGSVAVDRQFEELLEKIFGKNFIESFKQKRPIGWVDLMTAWESRKRATHPDRDSPLNVGLPFSFIDLHRKLRGFSVETALRNFNNPNIKWSHQGMLRLSASVMHDLFAPTLAAITDHVSSHMNGRISHLFLVGGFVDSRMLQRAMRIAAERRVKVIIPPDASLTILKGAVLFGLDPTTVRMRTCHMTYGVGVLNKFQKSIHPQTKMLTRGTNIWCKDVFDSYVTAGEAIALGDVVQRSYAPVRPNQSEIVINFYSCPRSEVHFIDEKDVTKCATIRIKLPQTQKSLARRELRISMMFGDTEIKIDCVDVSTGSRADARADFLT